MVREMAEVVTQMRQRMQIAQDRQKSYPDQRRRMLEFTVRDQVFLKIAPMKGVMQFGKKREIEPEIRTHFLSSKGLEMLPTNLTFLHQCLKCTMCFMHPCKENTLKIFLIY